MVVCKGKDWDEEEAVEEEGGKLEGRDRGRLGGEKDDMADGCDRDRVWCSECGSSGVVDGMRG